MNLLDEKLAKIILRSEFEPELFWVSSRCPYLQHMLPLLRQALTSKTRDPTWPFLCNPHPFLPDFCSGGMFLQMPRVVLVSSLSLFEVGELKGVHFRKALSLLFLC